MDQMLNWIDPSLLSPSYLFLALLIVVLVKFLHIFSEPQQPEIGYAKRKNNRISLIIDRCPLLNKPYKPPVVWGRNGHIQTATYGLLGHASLRREADKRHCVRLPDGTTVTFDVFEKTKPHPTDGDFTLALCPGIANSSESNYIRTCVHFAQEHGYRCAVLNHLGALKDVELTGNRVFSYGGIEEIDAMMNLLVQLHPNTRFVSIGFSMGGNITTRYLALCDQKIKSRVIMGLSVCQGYDAEASIALYHDWEGGRRAYNYIITENVKRLLRRNFDKAVAPHIKSGLVDEQRLWTATSIVALDEQYNRRVYKFANVDDYYRWSSSIHVIPKLRVPIIFLNALDDPIIPPSLWEPVRRLAHQMPETAFILTKHGGHLGFLEGPSFHPHSVTWLDRFVVEMAHAAVDVYGGCKEEAETSLYSATD